MLMAGSYLRHRVVALELYRRHRQENASATKQPAGLLGARDKRVERGRQCRNAPARWVLKRTVLLQCKRLDKEATVDLMGTRSHFSALEIAPFSPHSFPRNNEMGQ
ncbi:unnamed protein product [Durusdinium trenchii]|uniref:Uncharacterized protein n=1 Tax=Durusdinium trenchii TaxID=1381693 RepID=A0ABP0QX32_9DINO